MQRKLSVEACIKMIRLPDEFKKGVLLVSKQTIITNISVY
jgi:hypothetical protein